MTSKEFVIWLKGFTEGVHEFNVTPKQWDYLKEKLAEVTDDNLPTFPFGVPNTTPMWQHPHYPTPIGVPYTPQPDPYNPFKITCSSGSFGTTITATPGTGYITVANPHIASFGSGSTSTSYGYPSGSAWHYTNGGNDIKD